eukprot:Gb_19820 [translate_table: standard]
MRLSILGLGMSPHKRKDKRKWFEAMEWEDMGAKGLHDAMNMRKKRFVSSNSIPTVDSGGPILRAGWSERIRKRSLRSGFLGTMREDGCGELLSGGEIFLYSAIQCTGRQSDFMAGMLPGVECARRRRFHQGGSLDLQHWGADRRSRRSSFCLYQSNLQDHSYDSHFTRQSDSYLQQPQPHSMTRSIIQPRSEQQGEGHKLHEAAREARERLDERLRAVPSSNRRRNRLWGRNSQHDHGNVICEEDRRGTVSCLEEEVWPTSIRGWLASAASVAEFRRSGDSVTQKAQPSSMGLSKACIDLLPREIFASKEKTNGKHNWIKLNIKASQQEECPVCLDSFQTGQVLIHLPCVHRFHSSCLIPWLNNHCHCPCCRTKISIKAP